MPPKAKAKAKAKVKVEKKKAVIKVKKELVKVKTEKGLVKKEITDDSKTGIRKPKGFDAKTHYRHQVSFLDEVVPPPWKKCFGALGTGIIGIEPDTTKSKSSSSRAPVKVKVEPKDDDEAEEGPRTLPSTATVVLLLNSQTAGLQGRNGAAMGGYCDALDVKKKCLHWKSQRCDLKSTKIGAIVAHSRSGGRVVVGTRSSISDVADDGAKFKLLGQVSRIDNVMEAQFLVEEGAMLLCDGNKLHKGITAACLDAGLKMGIGLQTKRYPLPEKIANDYRFCRACCYAEANCRLHFDNLNEDAVVAYCPRPVRNKFAKAVMGKLKVKKELVKVKKEQIKIKKEPGAADSPAGKRMRCKQEPPGFISVKKERDEPAGSVRLAATASSSKPRGKLAKDVAIKKEVKTNGLAESVLKAMAKGQKFSVCTKYGLERVCTVVQVTKEQVKFHYEGFGDQYDEWIAKTSDRIVKQIHQVEAASGATGSAVVTQEPQGSASSSSKPNVLQMLAKSASPSEPKNKELNEPAPTSPGPSDEKKEDSRLLIAMSLSPSAKAVPSDAVDVVDDSDEADDVCMPVVTDDSKNRELEVVGVDLDNEDSCPEVVDSQKRAAEDSQDCADPVVQRMDSKLMGVDAE